MIYDEQDLYFIEHLLENLPNYIFWKDKNLVFKWCNKPFARQFGYENPKNIIGKSDYDFPWSEELRDKYIEDDRRILLSGKAKLNYEEDQIQADGIVKTVLVSKIPVRDNNKVVIGILGVYTDITDRKKAERLTLENELQKTKINETMNFKKIADQVAHDIRSPLASLLMIVEACKKIPELERVSLREVASTIGDIANILLSKYKKYSDDTYIEAKAPQPVLVSLILSEVLSEKKYQYKNSLVKIKLLHDKKDNFVFVNVDYSNFIRMMSNLINNAVEALEDKRGTVSIKLKSDGEHVNITVQDDGKGMPQRVIDSLMNNIAITSGKKNGSGIGFAQARSTLLTSNGRMSIKSKIGKGTKIVLNFPKVDAPGWMAEQINLHQGDIVIILDDDPSIHNAWKARFNSYKSKVELHHFTSGQEAVTFIDSLPKKDKVFLLSDHELIDQRLSGLQIIEKIDLHHRSVLVTSYYNNRSIIENVIKMGIKILPKQLASIIPIKVEGAVGEDTKDHVKKVDLVVLDDDKIFADSLSVFFRNRSLKVDVYYDAKDFISNLSKYPKNIKIYLDNDLRNHITGIELAKHLSELGYMNLYLLSGTEFVKGNVPDYLTTIIKGDLEALNKSVQN